jgi:hypothetical protein
MDGIHAFNAAVKDPLFTREEMVGILARPELEQMVHTLLAEYAVDPKRGAA